MEGVVRSAEVNLSNLKSEPVHPRVPGSETGLDVENTISPINCSGKTYGPSRPFLTPPYHGFVTLYSYFDHDSPDFTQDGTIVVANGIQVQQSSNGASRFGVTPEFPAYWSDALRQYIYYDGHNGYDYGLVYQPVYAAGAGRVIFAGWNYPGQRVTGYGRMVMIDHGHGYVSLYGHLSKLKVHAGEHVRAGQQIAISGNTGHSSGPHLHFTIFHNCRPTDPYGWTGSGTDPLESYQGESSSYLWKVVPPVYDPFPNFPGNKTMPAPPFGQTLNLSLPMKASLASLLDAVNHERKVVSRELRQRDLPVHYDWTAAAFLFPKPLKVSVLYSLPYVSSVVPDTYTYVASSEASLTDRLAQQISTVNRRDTLRGGQWRAFLLHTAAGSFLLGYGPVHENASFHVKGGTSIPMATETNNVGAFAVPVSADVTRRHPLVVVSTTGKSVLRPPLHRKQPVSPPKSHPGGPKGSVGGGSQPGGRGSQGHESTDAIFVVGPFAMGALAVLLGCVLLFRRRLVAHITDGGRE